MIKLKELLKEELPPKVKNLVGNVLLGGRDAIAKLQKKKRETNTYWENDLEDALENWVSDSTDELADHFTKNKKVYDQLIDEFPAVMEAPQGKVVYRGTLIKLDTLENALETRPFKVVNITTRTKKRTYLKYSKLPYSPNRPAQSWTMSAAIAMNFGSVSMNSIQVIYKTKTDDSFIFNPKVLRLLATFDEKEVVRVAGDGEFEALIDAKFLAQRRLLHKVKRFKAYFEEARISWNEKQAPNIAKKVVRDYIDSYKLEDLIVTSWSDLDKVNGYDSGLGPVGIYYKEIVNKVLETLAK